jgi:hypothetical protein
MSRTAGPEVHVLEKREPKSAAAVLEDLRVAALSAISTFGDDTRAPFDDLSNPYTVDLSPYDLARLFFPTRGNRDNQVADLEAIVSIIRGTTGSDAPRRAATRARWVAHELHRLGYHKESKMFQAVAEEWGVQDAT